MISDDQSKLKSDIMKLLSTDKDNPTMLTTINDTLDQDSCIACLGLFMNQMAKETRGSNDEVQFIIQNGRIAYWRKKLK